MAELGVAARRLAPQLRRFLIGLFLIAAFATTGAVLLFVITADQLQNSMSAPDITTKSTIGAIRQDVATVEYYYKQLDAISKKLTAADEALAQTDVASQGALARMTSSADDITAFINQNDAAYIRPPLRLRAFVRTPARAPAPAAAAPVAAPGDDTAAPAPQTPAQLPILDFGGAVTGYFSAYYAELDAAAPSPETDAARAALNTFKTQVYKPFDSYLRAHSEYDADKSRLESLNVEIAALEARNAGLDTVLAPKGTPLGDSTAYWNLCEDFFSFKTLVGDWAYSIVLLPKMMLVLTLSIFMGILGSLIYIAQDFLKDPDRRGLWDILFRIGLGAGVAFALFFFAAAGMLAMTQNTSGTQSDMSPYLISFLGITGGYLSDRVTQWMREVGENTFKVSTGGPPPRWAVGLDAALKAAGLDSATLASATGVTTADSDGWMSLAKAVPGDKQALVAAFLRVHPSHLFTDIAPG